MTIQSINPTNGTLIATYQEDDDERIERLLNNATRAFATWKNTPLSERSASLKRVASNLRKDVERHASLMTEEMGKPNHEARAEIQKCAWVLDYYAENAPVFLAPKDVPTDGQRSFVRFDPLGPLLAVMPWNFPYWQVFRFAAPTLVSGNVNLLKHAPNVSGCAEAIHEVFVESGLPLGVFQVLLVGTERVADLIADERVCGVTLTGSEAAGRAVGAHAGKAIKPSVLELGGSDPLVVLSDGDPTEAARVALKSRMLNTGQSCIAAKRLIVVDRHYETFINTLLEGVRALVLGDPSDPETDIGPLAKQSFVESLHQQVVDSVALGARCLAGGHLLNGPGAFYPPTVLVDVDNRMPCFREETFGPVAVCMRAQTDEEALAMANDSRYGLGASLWTSPQRGVELATRIDSGHVAINGMVKSDPRLPFGGIKNSGYGRELSDYGLLPFLNVKTVWLG